MKLVTVTSRTIVCPTRERTCTNLAQPILSMGKFDPDGNHDPAGLAVLPHITTQHMLNVVVIR